MSDGIQFTTYCTLVGVGQVREEKITLDYDAANPYFVTVEFANAATPVELSRNFMDTATVTMTSEGAVQGYPHVFDDTQVTFAFSAGTAVFFVHVNKIELDEFLADSYDVVANESEIDFAMEAVEDFLETAS